MPPSPSRQLTTDQLAAHVADLVHEWMRYVTDAAGDEWRLTKQADGSWLASSSGTRNRRFTINVTVTEVTANG